jgi:hypothetical protein
MASARWKLRQRQNNDALILDGARGNRVALRIETESGSGSFLVMGGDKENDGLKRSVKPTTAHMCDEKRIMLLDSPGLVQGAGAQGGRGTAQGRMDPVSKRGLAWANKDQTLRIK